VVGRVTGRRPDTSRAAFLRLSPWPASAETISHGLHFFRSSRGPSFSLEDIDKGANLRQRQCLVDRTEDQRQVPRRRRTKLLVTSRERHRQFAFRRAPSLTRRPRPSPGAIQHGRRILMRLDTISPYHTVVSVDRPPVRPIGNLFPTPHAPYLVIRVGKAGRVRETRQHGEPKFHPASCDLNTVACALGRKSRQAINQRVLQTTHLASIAPVDGSPLTD
jgi:hypothetical protein